MTLKNSYKNHPHFSDLSAELKNYKPDNILLKGLKGSAPSLLAAALTETSNGLHIFILNEKEEAAYFAGDLSALLGEQQVFFFPSSYKRSIQYNQLDSQSVMLRSEVLLKLADTNLNKQQISIITYPDAIAEKVISQQELNKSTLQLHVNEKISISFIKEVMIEYSFERVDFVYEPGQYAIRGSIVDIFSFSSDLPYRIDFFGDEIESIRSFDIESQLSKEKMQRVSILPNIQSMVSNTNFFDLLPSKTYLWFNQSELVCDRIEQLMSFLPSESDSTKSLISRTDFESQIQKYVRLEFGQLSDIHQKNQFVFSTNIQPTFNKQFDMLIDSLNEYSEKGYTNLFLTDNPKQAERIKQIIHDLKKQAPLEPITSTIHEGFIDNDLKICFFTDHQIFERYHKYKIRQGYKKSEALTISELNSLKPGDYIVHVDHGIGKFGGLEKHEINGKIQEVIKLVYKDNDILYISIHYLHRISKYRDKDGEPPKIHKLGSGAWQKLKDNTKKKVKDIARDLILLYAKRMATVGYSFSPDTYLQQELEASFLYEDTPDQEKATRMVKAAMESEHPMDMLVCGDVGFGKTEIAVRAAFKAVADSKQVAILVPTTILTLQHFNTFSERLKGLPCNVDYVSRFRTASQQKVVLGKVKEGKVDILIGTHRILAKDIQFKNLGLLIIDEEQKFGVAAKEKLKSMKANVDTLTLTATPIPRTLQFSLMGARDLSIINTPPPNRHPIQTELHTFSTNIIKEAIEFEISRNGQIFFIHNRVQNILEVDAMLRKICPGISTAVAHGQMEAEELEKVMVGFIAGDYDVLIATNIIESGLDIPNANTIIINNAQNFGLSDLHQLRGRVGRSNKKAFCYLIAPPLTNLTGDARRRLKAIEDFSDLGSGFNIAMQDLDIRGAGNLLGSEQSGFIAEMGIETYRKILNEAIQELKESEFKDLFFEQQDAKEQSKEKIKFVNDCLIDTDLEILIPDSYVSNISERTRLYKDLDNLENEENLLLFEKSLLDRFGILPTQVSELMEVVRLRWKAMDIGIDKIVIRNNRMLAYFIANPKSPFYQTTRFQNVMQNIQKNSKYFKIKEAKDRLALSSENITSIQQSIQLIELLSKV